MFVSFFISALCSVILLNEHDQISIRFCSNRNAQVAQLLATWVETLYYPHTITLLIRIRSSYWPEQATSTYSCNGVFTDLVVRTILAPSIISSKSRQTVLVPTQTSNDKLQTWKGYFLTLVFLFLFLPQVHLWSFHFRREMWSKMYLKIERSVITRWHGPCMGVQSRFGLWIEY